MKLVDVLLLSLAAVFIIIGAYETYTSGIGTAYWSIMIALGLLFYFVYRRKK